MPNPFTEISARINRTLRMMVLAAAGAAAAMTALFFLILGLFLWLREVYGTTTASLALGGAFAFIAFVAFVSVFLMQRRAATAREEARAAQLRAAAQAAQFSGAPWWADPTLLTTGAQVLRTLGGRRTLPLTLAAVLAGVALGGAWARRHPSSPAPARGKPNGSGTFSEVRH